MIALELLEEALKRSCYIRKDIRIALIITKRLINRNKSIRAR